jgi:HAD superfamily hydrolase (TIGR01509 family)
MKANAHLRGVLFDVDGTLIDSNDAHARAWVEALRDHGIEVSFERVRPLIGMGGDKLLPLAADIDAGSATGKAIAHRRLEIFLSEHLGRLKPLPGARALLLFLASRGLQNHVASSAQPRELRPLLEQASVADLIDDGAASGDGRPSKPDPDILRAALERAQLSPDQVIFVGDTPYDIEAGWRCGVATVAVRCGGWSDTSLDGASAIYDDPGDLLAHFGESPLAR